VSIYLVELASPTNTTLLGKCPSEEIVSEESIPLLLVKKAGLLDIRVHDVPHACATLLLN
jgi:hypothetical protein